MKHKGNSVCVSTMIGAVLFHLENIVLFGVHLLFLASTHEDTLDNLITET